MKAVSDNYQVRPMHILCGEVLEILRSNDGRPIRCGHIGEQLFHDAIHRGSAPFARIAGKVMKRLKRSGLVKWSSTEYGGWELTARGRRCDHLVCK